MKLEELSPRDQVYVTGKSCIQRGRVYLDAEISSVVNRTVFVEYQRPDDGVWMESAWTLDEIHQTKLNAKIRGLEIGMDMIDGLSEEILRIAEVLSSDED